LPAAATAGGGKNRRADAVPHIEHQPSSHHSGQESLMGRLKTLVLGISKEETTFARRGFRAGDAEARRRLERSGECFVIGYEAALEDDGPAVLAQRLDDVQAEFRGFAFEGAGMGLALLDFLTPWRAGRLGAFLAGPGDAHAYMVHVGVGWAIARLPWLRARIDAPLKRLDSLLRWLAVDGYGFHEGYFHWRRSVRGQVRPRRLAGYASRAFDQGLGRGLWFVEGADVGRIPSVIAAFPAGRRADLWSGVGLAAAYAGGVDRAGLERLRIAAGDHMAHVAQGVAFAAKARVRGGNPATHTELACQVLCGMSADEAAKITDVALEGLAEDGTEPAYETWRRRIRDAFAPAAVMG
jgi:hypothetical protein